MRCIQVSKAAGPDNLPAQLIRDGAEQIAAILHFLANQSLRSGSFPNSEKCARLTPIYKSGEKSNFDNYRPISVLNILSKVLERLVHRQISDYLERNNLLSCSQFGFRGERSTQHAVTLFTEHIRNNMEQSRCTGALFMDSFIFLILYYLYTKKPFGKSKYINLFTMIKTNNKNLQPYET